MTSVTMMMMMMIIIIIIIIIIIKIVTAVYSVKYLQAYSALFSHGQTYSGTLRYAEIYSNITEAYRVIFRNIRNSAEPLYIPPCHIQNPSTFIT